VPATRDPVTATPITKFDDIICGKWQQVKATRDIQAVDSTWQETKVSPSEVLVEMVALT
jgi:hypothetical protein